MATDDVLKDRFVFPPLIDGYIRGLGDRFTAETRVKLKAAGLDVDKLPPAIPATEINRYIEIVAQGAFPDEPRLEQLRLLGLSAIRGWKTGLLGSAASQMLRIVGPRRTLTRLDRAFSTTNNFTRATTEFVADKEALVTINDVQEMPSYWVGIFEAGLEILGLEGTVTVEAQKQPEAVFRLTWK